MPKKGDSGLLTGLSIVSLGPAPIQILVKTFGRLVIVIMVPATAPITQL
jgi:hypothetical protein